MNLINKSNIRACIAVTATLGCLSALANASGSD